MTDRELLELAAKAAGIDGTYVERTRMIREFCFKKFQYIQANGAYWNPLKDDGDAFRLAVKLGMAVSVCTSYTVILGVFDENGHVKEIHNNDPYAATRRAIVRAAAEINKEQA